MRRRSTPASIARRGRPSPDRVVARGASRRPGSQPAKRSLPNTATRDRPPSAGAPSRSSLTAYATLIAAEEGAVDLDEPAGPEGSTVRHLLAHASGLAWDSSQPLTSRASDGSTRTLRLRRACCTRRSADGDPVSARYLAEAVLVPLGLEAALEGDAAAGMVGNLRDMLSFGREAPGADADRARDARRGNHSAVPRPGRRAARLRPPAPERLGARFRAANAKAPHWTGSLNSPRTFGHFG